MAHFPNHRGWMYNRCYSGRRGLKEAFVLGVNEFVETARQYQYYALDRGIRCPCIKCECTKILKDEVVKVHLYQKGFMPNYKVWTFHGEEMPSTSTAHENRLASSSNTIVHTSEIDQFTYMQEMVDNAFRQHAKESPNESTQRFYNLLAEANQPVFEAALGRAVHVDEVFTQTYIRKGTDEYVDERSRKTIEDFSARLTQARLEGGSGPDGRVDADEEMIRTQCWVDTVGGKKKGRLYGVGQHASHYSVGRGGIFRNQPSTSTIFDPKIVVSKDAYDSLLARFENLENLVRTLVPQQGHTTPSSSQQPCPPQQPPSHTTVVQDEDSDDSDDPDDYHRF